MQLGNQMFVLADGVPLIRGAARRVCGGGYGKIAVDELLTKPAIEAISFVGSTPIARYGVVIRPNGNSGLLNVLRGLRTKRPISSSVPVVLDRVAMAAQDRQ